jgi:hypothetical protein
MVPEQDAQNHTCQGREFPDDASEKALHNQEDQRRNDEKIQQIHGEFLSKAESGRQGNWSLT